MVIKLGPAYLSIATITLSTPGALCSFILLINVLTSISVVCLHTCSSWALLSNESFIHSCPPSSCFISISLMSCSPLCVNIADHCPENFFASSSKTISSIRALSVASFPCASLTAVSTSFFLTVLLTNLHNCLDDKADPECNLRLRQHCRTLSVICNLRVFASILKKYKSFSFFFSSSVQNPCKVFSYSCCLTCDSATMHFLRSFHINLHTVAKVLVCGFWLHVNCAAPTSVSWRYLHFSPVYMGFQSANTTKASKASLYASAVLSVGPMIGLFSWVHTPIVQCLTLNLKKIAEWSLPPRILP